MIAGTNGMDLIANILRMYQRGDRHVEVLTASVRAFNLRHELTDVGEEKFTGDWNALIKPRAAAS